MSLITVRRGTSSQGYTAVIVRHQSNHTAKSIRVCN